MPHLRFTLVGLLCGVVIIALLLVAANSLLPEASDEAVATGGLSLCTLLFAALCRLFGHSVWRTLWFSALFFFWGHTCLLLGDTVNLDGRMRTVLAGLGVIYATWAWFSPAHRGIQPKIANE